MEVDLIFKGLVNFVSSQDQFAVMVDGTWGSGKTYFIKNRVIPELRENHKVVYFSVYGYESLSELKSDLTGNLFISSLGKSLEDSDTRAKVDDAVSIAKGAIDVVGNKLSAFKSLASAAGNFVIKKQLQEQGKKVTSVLVIDDLERISRNIHTSDLLGFLLTNVIEPYGYRVIIIGNSKEIRNGEADEFKMIREKIISRIFPFSQNYRNIQKDFFENSKIDFLRKNAEWLVGVLSEYARHNEEHINLRTLEFILSTFIVIDKGFNDYWQANSNGKAESNEIKQSAFLNLFVISNEYREGRLTRKDLPQLDTILYTKNFFFMHLEKNEAESMAELITIHYHDDHNLRDRIMYSNEINGAIFNGVFDAKTFIEKWLVLFKPKITISHLDEIANFRDMTDEQLSKIQAQLLSESLNSEVTIKKLLSTINVFLFFAKNNLYFGDEDFLPQLLNSLDIAVKRLALRGDVSFDYVDVSFMYDVIAKDKDVMGKIQKIFKSASDTKHDNDTERLINAIFSDDYETIQETSKNGFNINIFRAILDSKYLHKDLLVVKSKAPLLDRYLQSEYIHISNSKGLHKDENSDILRLIKSTSRFIDTSSEIGRIDRFNLNNLRTTLDEILVKFSD